ncbi:sporulation protein YtxC [Gorillibacterium sp. sgz5001074]|uniref:sporulation protein YtxC n=1 Tax=Gorillibacterium sp. sgz5001074 TaxID=3446695 RepID=UPI003F6704C2
MDKLTLQILPDSVIRGQDLYDCLFQHIDSTLHNSSLEWNHHKGFTEITVGRPQSRAGKSSKVKADWLESVSGVLADYLLEHAEDFLLTGMIRRGGQYKEEETADVLGYCKQIMSEEDSMRDPTAEQHGRTRRKKLLTQDLLQCVQQEPILNVDGFLRFRLAKYGGELKDIIEYAKDEYLMDQQYKEFIALLKYFVYIQDAKIPEAHLLHKGGHEFLLLNEQLKPIETDQLDTTFKVEFLDKDYSFEDLIVSTLITIAPEKIYIHTREPGVAVIKTISQIFEGRSEICDYCGVCGSILGNHSHQDKLSP